MRVLPNVNPLSRVNGVGVQNATIGSQEPARSVLKLAVERGCENSKDCLNRLAQKQISVNVAGSKAKCGLTTITSPELLGAGCVSDVMLELAC